MEIIDTVSASTLDVGDTIRFIISGEDRGLQEIKSIEETFEFDGLEILLVTSTEDDETFFDPYTMVSIYGYMNGEE